MQNVNHHMNNFDDLQERTTAMTHNLYFVEYCFFYFTGFIADKVLLYFANNRELGSVMQPI